MRTHNPGLAGVLVAALLCTAAGAAAPAQGRGRGQAKTVEPAAAPVVVQFEISARDRETIAAYYKTRTSGLPPGLAKRDGALPPGLAKQLRRNGTLPPGLQKKLTPLPQALERRLAPLPAGYRRAIVDVHLIMFRPDNYLITDVFLDIVR